jgi:hypothetical protein
VPTPGVGTGLESGAAWVGDVSGVTCGEPGLCTGAAWVGETLGERGGGAETGGGCGDDVPGDGDDVEGDVEGAEGALVCARQGRGNKRNPARTAKRMSCSSGLTPNNHYTTEIIRLEAPMNAVPRGEACRTNSVRL